VDELISSRQHPAVANLAFDFEAGLFMETFNVLNHVNVQNIDQVYGAADFLGRIPRQFGDGIGSPANPTFGTPNYTGPARQLQASLRFNF
jgi:hypothetical protein